MYNEKSKQKANQTAEKYLIPRENHKKDKSLVKWLAPDAGNKEGLRGNITPYFQLKTELRFKQIRINSGREV